MATHILKTNTAARITVGPFLDKTDGVTPETALTVTSCKLTMTVDTGGVPTLVLDTNPTASGGSNDMVHITGDDAGMYDLELAAANVNYVGNAKVIITDAATHCPVVETILILPALVYDSLIAGTDALQVDAVEISSDATAAANLETAFDDTAGEVPWLSIIDQGTAQSISGADVTIRAAAAFGDNTINGNTMLIKGSTNGNYWQSRMIISSSGDIMTLDQAPTVTPTGTLSYKIIGTPPSIQTSGSLPRVDLRNIVGSAVSTSTAQLGVNVVNNAGSAITAAAGVQEVKVQSVATDAITAGSIAPNAIGASELAADAATEIAAAVLTVALTESYAADGAAPTLTQAVMAIQQFLQEKAISGTTMTIKKLDGSTTAMTFTLNDATTPTSVTRAS